VSVLSEESRKGGIRGKGMGKRQGSLSGDAEHAHLGLLLQLVELDLLVELYEFLVLLPLGLL
jgi:hypothetical protein